MTPAFSIVIPTYRRGEDLAECLASVCALEYPKDRIEVIIVDNGGAENTRTSAAPFMDRLTIRYLVNEQNRGYGYSVNRGIAESTGDAILLLNDDARPMPDILNLYDALLASDPLIGCVGCRAIEKDFLGGGEGIGVIANGGELIGNFDVDCGTREVSMSMVCYFFTREAVRRRIE